MSNTIDTTKMSFWQLISNTSKIEIPIIQRDYVQGRDDDKTKKIRENFLDSLFTSIKADNKPQELDFVYGSTVEGAFQPLDGQQRLTTLFLLHWYVSKAENRQDEVKETLETFTYETRISSHEFCKALVERGNDLGSGDTISKQIKDATWFFISWEKDPTIKAMLEMLDTIEIKCKKLQLSNTWEKLTSDNPPITFHFRELSQFGLADDLYIKMNARGIGLTIFEHFKASMKKVINDQNFERDTINLPTHFFSHKIDTIWTDLFWKYKNAENYIDNIFTKFISDIALNYYAQNLDIFQSEEQDLLVRAALEEKNKVKFVSPESIKRESVERRIQDLFNKPEEINANDFYQEDGFKYLVSCLDIYADKAKSYDTLTPNNLPLWDYCKDSTLFKEHIKIGEITYAKRVLFYAQTTYLLNHTMVDNTSFADWMRVVRNIVQNSTIDSAANYIRAIGLVNELSKGSGDIYSYLSANNVISKFAEEQLKEESLKAKLITKSKDYKKVIFDTEDTNFCKGKISFALYCIDVNVAVDRFDVAKLSNIQLAIKAHLSDADITNEFRRALLTIGNNDFYEYWGTWSWSTDSHKRCLIESTNNLKNEFIKSGYRDYLKELLNILISKKLKEVIENFVIPKGMPKWKVKLISEPNLLDTYCQSRYFGISDSNDSCFLFYHRKRPNSREICYEVK